MKKQFRKLISQSSFYIKINETNEHIAELKKKRNNTNLQYREHKRVTSTVLTNNKKKKLSTLYANKFNYLEKKWKNFLKYTTHQIHTIQEKKTSTSHHILRLILNELYM